MTAKKGAKERWIDSLVAKRRGRYSEAELAAYRAQMVEAYAAWTDEDVLAAKRRMKLEGGR